MLPTKVKQLEYLEIQNIINVVCEEKLIHLNFDCVFTESVSGTFVASLLSKRLGVPMLFRQDKEYNQLENYNKVLLVDLISHDNNLNSLKLLLCEKFKKDYLTFGVLSDNTDTIIDFYGIKNDLYYLTPWNQGSYTPQSHLSRLLDNSKHSFERNQVFYGFSSKKCLESLVLYHNKNYNISEISIFDEEVHKKISSSQINISDTSDTTLSIKEYYLKNKPYFTNKIDFIKNNGITDFYDESLQDSIIISSHCPITKIYFVDKNGVYHIKVNSFI
jgi:hypothetical protein